MTSSLERQGSASSKDLQPAATGPEPSSGVGPAFHLDEPAPYSRSLRSYAAGYQS